MPGRKIPHGFPYGNLHGISATENNSIDNVKLLLEHGANFEIRDKIRDKENRQPIDLTSDDGIKQILTSIEEIFELATIGDSEALINKLQSCPTALYARNSQGYTSLQVTIQKSHLDALASVISYRIDNLRQRHTLVGAQLDKLMEYSKAVRRHMSNLEAICANQDSFCDVVMIDVDDFKTGLTDLLNNAFCLLKIYKEQCDLKLTQQQHLIIIDESLEFFGFQKASEVSDKRVHPLLMNGEFVFTVNLLKLCIVAPIQFFMTLIYSAELRDAARNQNMSLVEKCLTGNPNIESTDGRYWTALHYALSCGNVQIAKLLLDFGADPTKSSDKKRVTPLRVALKPNLPWNSSQHIKTIEVIQLHLKYIKDDKLVGYLNAKDNVGSTALHLAVQLRDVWLVKLLLSKGSIYCIKNNDGKSPENLTNNYDTSTELLQRIDRLFAYALNGKPDKLLDELRSLEKDNYNDDILLAIGGARNKEGCTLVQILEREGQVDVANVKEMLASIKDILELKFT